MQPLTITVRLRRRTDPSQKTEQQISADVLAASAATLSSTVDAHGTHQDDPHALQSDAAVSTVDRVQRRVSDTYDPLKALETTVVSAIQANNIRAAREHVMLAAADKSYARSTRETLKYTLNTLISFASAHRDGVTPSATHDLTRAIHHRFAAALDSERVAVIAFNKRQLEQAATEKDSIAVRAASNGKFVEKNHPTAQALNRQIAERGFAVGKAAVTFIAGKMISAEGQRTIREHFNGSTVSSGMYIVITDAVVVGMTAAYASEKFGAGRNALHHKQAVLELADTLSGQLRGPSALDDVSMWGNALWAVTFTNQDLNILRRACNGSLNFKNWGLAYKTGVSAPQIPAQ